MRAKSYSEHADVAPGRQTSELLRSEGIETQFGEAESDGKRKEPDR